MIWFTPICLNMTLLYFSISFCLNCRSAYKKDFSSCLSHSSFLCYNVLIVKHLDFCITDIVRNQADNLTNDKNTKEKSKWNWFVLIWWVQSSVITYTTRSNFFQDHNILGCYFLKNTRRIKSTECHGGLIIYILIMLILFYLLILTVSKSSCSLMKLVSFHV